MSCGVGLRRGLDPLLLWLWRRPAGAAPIRSLAWEFPYAAGAALEKAKKKKNYFRGPLTSGREILALSGLLCSWRIIA